MKWDPVDIVVFILTVAVITVLLSSIAYYYINSLEISERTSEVIESITTSIITIVSMYVGYKIKSK